MPTLRPATLSAERFKAFVDAVVAIAMTLLILPLMEAVSEAGRRQAEEPSYGTLDFLQDHTGQIISLMLSFLLIAQFWMAHHQQYDGIERITRPLIWMNVFWMFTIVCLPVTTALIGAMHTDAAQRAIYMGNLAMTQFASLLARLYVLRHPDITTAPLVRVRLGAIADATATVLFVLALVVSQIFPQLSYGSLFLLLFTSVATHLASRRWRNDAAAAEE